MEGKLVKRNEDDYLLYVNDVLPFATIENSPYKRLSLKNCQAISNGYDLDELAEEWCMKPENNWSNNNNEVGDNYGSYKEGFQKALEILGDKKYSISDMEKLMFATIEFTEQEEGETYLFLKNYIQSLQQTEWDVEIELICPHPSDTYVCGMQYGCDGDGCNHPEQIPYLDSGGCLILKRI
jgi:hypothetical protein